MPAGTGGTGTAGAGWGGAGWGGPGLGAGGLGGSLGLACSRRLLTWGGSASKNSLGGLTGLMGLTG